MLFARTAACIHTEQLVHSRFAYDSDLAHLAPKFDVKPADIEEYIKHIVQ